MSNHQIYWKIEKLDEQGATINIAYGERSNGKSYQVKHKKGVLNYLQETPSYVDSNSSFNDSATPIARIGIPNVFDASLIIS